MLLSTTTAVIEKKLGDAGAIRLYAAAGFDAYDMNFMPMLNAKDHPMNRDNWRDYIKNLRRVADQTGIVCNQAHAPFSSSNGTPGYDDTRFSQIVRCMEAASILGAKIIIVHPKQHLKYREEGNPEKLKELNMEFYGNLIPYCEKFGIKIAIENMWQYNNRIVDSVCSSAEEFCDYIDTIGSPWVVACLDIGHVALVDRDIPDMIRHLGHRLGALHVHDNNFKEDMHTLPLLSHIDFDEVTKALRHIGYAGDFTFEAENFFSKMPREILPAAARLLHDTGRYLMNKIK